MTDRAVLNYSTASVIGDIIEIAQTGAKVSWVTDDGDIIDGIARHLVKDPDNAVFLGSKDDVRDSYLRVTTKNGWEAFLPVAELITKVLDNTFLQHNWS